MTGYLRGFSSPSVMVQNNQSIQFHWNFQVPAKKTVSILHGGVISTFLDNLCGMSCSVAIEEFRFVATLDLRIDYSQMPPPPLSKENEAWIQQLLAA